MAVQINSDGHPQVQRRSRCTKHSPQRRARSEGPFSAGVCLLLEDYPKARAPDGQMSHRALLSIYSNGRIYYLGL